MRSYQSAPALAALLATAVSALSPARLHCLRNKNVELSRLSGCGMAGSVAHCLWMIPDDFTLADLETCYINAGCDFTEAIVEAQWVLNKCDESGELAEELRLRHVVARATTTDSETTATDEATTATGATTAATATAATTAASTGTGTTGTTGTATGTGSSTTKICSTTTTKSTSACPVYSTGASSGKTISSGCYSTTVAFETCAAGMLCQDDQSGNPSCILIDNTLGGAGIAISLFFAIAITGAIATITFLCCRERKEKKRIMAKAEAAAIAKAAVIQKRPTVEVHPAEPANQPLMGNDNHGQAYNSQDPFNDQSRH
ncbi:hypothetical protein C8034_v000526 [Colletotrichum sidae]|uniref:Extracellular membrane protein CFEM domain-containing protein n=1 Tax=Colletotrichum sidae TaxID=1347389 RepID=A0A4V3I171_9PEZI|nr:hypothetical protein C8034_v000526 [Colletotrichum sidae]